MKWFRHMANASNDEFIEGLEEEFGLEGYARWWKMLETIAQAMDKNRDDPTANHTIEKWSAILKTKRKVLLSFLEHSGNKNKIKWKLNGNIITITCPNLLKMRDEYSKKSRHYQEHVPEVDTDTDTDTDTERDNPLPLKPENQEALFQSLPEEEKSDRFEEFWQIFPNTRKGNKEKAKQAYQRAKERATEAEIIKGAAAYRKSDEVAHGYAKGAAAWLNDDRWTSDYSVVAQPRVQNSNRPAPVVKQNVGEL